MISDISSIRENANVSLEIVGASNVTLVSVALVYPYSRPGHDNSVFRFPPLGLGYIASYLEQHGVKTNIVDCTFTSQKEAVKQIDSLKPEIIGVYSMFSMKHQALEMAKLLRGKTEMLVAGGPLPTLCPEDYLNDFNVVAIGEGEETTLELVNAFENHRSLKSVKGIAYKTSESKIIRTGQRPFIKDLDTLPFPDRDLFNNGLYKEHFQKRFGYTSTSLLSSRGCPFHCDFCSRAVFGSEFRARSAANVVGEIEEITKLGYDRIWFADDCFTLDSRRLNAICDAIIQQGLEVNWECLSRVDTINHETASKMKKAGCTRVFFGIESGNDAVLALMNKQATTAQAKKAVQTTKEAGLKTGAFFIVGYPGESDKTVLDTVRFASSLPLDYLSFTLPYPIPGTPLYERVKDRIKCDDLEQPKHIRLTDHKLLYTASSSELKLKFAILKGMAQFKIRKKIGDKAYRLLVAPFERLTDWVFRFLR